MSLAVKLFLPNSTANGEDEDKDTLYFLLLIMVGGIDISVDSIIFVDFLHSSCLIIGKYVISGSVSILQVEPEPPADYKCEFTNITVDATLQLASKESESSTAHLITSALEAIIKGNY